MVPDGAASSTMVVVGGPWRPEKGILTVGLEQRDWEDLEEPLLDAILWELLVRWQRLDGE